MGINPSARKSGTIELQRSHSALVTVLFVNRTKHLNVFSTMFLRQEMFISTLTNSRWREALFEGNYSFSGKSETSKESPYLELELCSTPKWCHANLPFPQESFRVGDRSALVEVPGTGVLAHMCRSCST